LLLALKANDKDTDPEKLVREIYQTVSQMKDQLSRDILLLIEQFVSFYKQISQETFERIKKEVNMNDYPETISEYYILEGEKRGEKKR
jgi:ABC-type branched-subunit amino acid transport system ATPase component